jgi:hypothetical protein
MVVAATSAAIAFFKIDFFCSRVLLPKISCAQASAASQHLVAKLHLANNSCQVIDNCVI